MNRQFWNDLNNAKFAETLVLETFQAMSDKYYFEDVSKIPQFYYRGDIRALAADGREIFIEVKDDSRVASSKNILCEEEVYYKDIDAFGKGNMQNDTDIYVVVSQKERKMYVLDFKVLKENYQKGHYEMIEHYSSTTFCYLCNIADLKKWGAVIAILDY